MTRTRRTFLRRLLHDAADLARVRPGPRGTSTRMSNHPPCPAHAPPGRPGKMAFLATNTIRSALARAEGAIAAMKRRSATVSAVPG